MAPPDVPDGSIVITPKEFYDGVRQDIADIKQSVAPLDGLVTRVVSVEAQVDALQAKLYYLAGGSAIVGALIGAVTEHGLFGH